MMNRPKTPEEFHHFYEGALAYLAVLAGEIIGADNMLVHRADRHKDEIKSSGLSPFQDGMRNSGAYWIRELAVQKLDERREAAEKAETSADEASSTTDRPIQTRNLPDDPAEAIRLLTNEVNRRSGQLAGLNAFVRSLGLGTNVPEQALVAQAHARLPPQLRPSGPFTETDHAKITIADLLG